ncbi:unnamed protein product [marine sediment metagenome]|uniref:Uncharacterized protein n=1 Tax=marine sediment metagenome TaxID=412755 RepID=X0SDM7_9ZZZZ
MVGKKAKYSRDNYPRYIIQTGKGAILDSAKDWNVAVRKAKKHAIERGKRFPLFIVKEIGQVRIQK